MEVGSAASSNESDKLRPVFPREVTDDYIEYFIHVADTSLTRFARRELLRCIHSSSQKLTKKLLHGYIWHSESFSLQQNHEKDADFLYGKTNVADCVEDEWLIVYLLCEVSKQFKEAWIRASDSDGEFLLIEAARALPKWINPEIADNRVWINQGRLYIIPRDAPNAKLTADSSGTLSRQQALHFLAHRRKELLHLDSVEEQAFERVKKYPDQIWRNLHRAQVLIPRKLALVLLKNPAYISSAIKALYLKDPIGTRAEQKQNRRSFAFPPGDLVRYPAKFTRVGFAQIKSEHFKIPQIWIHSVGEQNYGAPKQAWIDIGAKVSYGFEILLSDPKYQDSRTVREIWMILEDIKNGDEVLPSSSTVSSWDASEDDESWLDINYENFENELSGKRAKNSSKGFGDANTHENVRRIVSSFEDFLKDDTAGIDGIKLDEMDEDEESVYSGSVSNDEDEKPDIEDGPEDEFTELIRGMLGMDRETMQEVMGSFASPAQDGNKKTHEILNTGVDIQDGVEIERMVEAMESELGTAGSLSDLDFGNEKLPEKLDNRHSQSLEDLTTSSGYLSDERYHLAKNILESFKSQAGHSGPGGNLLNMMGLQLPRDEDEPENV